ncbi:MAG TPA: cbb3-type cytochrome oxidase assembly protein CcoS [Steroidobacteraceae bacterium]|jgi:cbb3-type cytochrome oxidase maturation protein|nr:cbb3-type cytochrome oxidase assembly protein CcoS [Steroidobacteraceae bacterium]
MDITFYMFFSAFLMSMSAWCIFLWAVRSGQFRDVEEAKYQLWPNENADVNEAAPKPTNA